MTYTADSRHHAVVTSARAAASDTVQCPHCERMVVRSRVDDHMQVHHKDELLAQREAVIERGFKTFLEVWQAFLDIDEMRLYEGQYATFKDYCEHRWQFSRQRGYQLLKAARLMSSLSTIVDAELLPERESHIRPLSGLPDEALIPVWTVIRDTAPGGKVTAAHTKSVVTFAKQMIETGAVDDGTGNSVRVADVAKAAITEETYERWQRQVEHINRNSKRQRVLSADGVISKIDKQDDGVYVTVRLSADTDITNTRAAYIARKPVFVNLYTEKDAS